MLNVRQPHTFNSTSSTRPPSPPPERIDNSYTFDWPPFDDSPSRLSRHSEWHGHLSGYSFEDTGLVKHWRDLPSSGYRTSSSSHWQGDQRLWGDMNAQNGYSYSTNGTPSRKGSYSQPTSHASRDVLNPFSLSRHSTALQQALSSQPNSRPSSRPESPVFQSSQSTAGGSSGPSSIAPYLQLPSTISPNGGSLAEFAAKVTCLFWFESAPTLAKIEEAHHLPPQTAKLDTGFLKWVTTILTTTQVSPNVILLALLFIYRLKKQNPSVKGKPGSEFRLLTVALMLGNKFLDDNTYTNKTWAEVSGIAVQEIHVMEVEFLSHMKYNLYTSKEEWLQWHGQLRAFWAYFDNMSRPQRESSQRPLSLRPLNLHIPHALPSPPNSTSASPPYANPASPYAPSFAQVSKLPVHLAPTASPANSLGEERAFPPRKRSWDEAAMALEPNAKRPYGFHPHTSTLSEGAFAPSSQMPGLPNLPMPNLQPSNNQGMQLPAPSVPTSANLSAMSTPNVSLPPVNWHQLPSVAGPQSRSGSRPSSFAFTSSNNTSPTSQKFPSVAAHSSGTSQLSPSQYLTYRNSPYKPVRNISTLLVPPPSGQMQMQPRIPYDQMSWMPLGRQNDLRSGRVPYLHREVWPQPNQGGDWTPVCPVRQ